jgi:hypothetical protein
VGDVVIGGMAMASTVDVFVAALFVFVERLASRRSGEAPGHANVPQLSPSEGTKMTKPTTRLPGDDIEQRFFNWGSAGRLKGSRSPTSAGQLL